MNPCGMAERWAYQIVARETLLVAKIKDSEGIQKWALPRSSSASSSRKVACDDIEDPFLQETKLGSPLFPRFLEPYRRLL